MQNDTFGFLTWPKVKVMYVTAESAPRVSELRRRAHQWLLENQVEFKEEPTISFVTFDLYVKDIKYLTLYKLKFSEICRD